MYFRLENKESQKAQEIGNLIRVYNRSKREEAESEPLNLYVEDEKGDLLAGLIAETFGNWLEIEYLFAKEELRGQGIGSKLLQQAETEAKNRNCRFAFVFVTLFLQESTFVGAIGSAIWIIGFGIYSQWKFRK